MLLDSTNNQIMDHNFEEYEETIVLHNIAAADNILLDINKRWNHFIKDEELLNKMYNKYKLMFCNHYMQVSHIVYKYVSKYKDKSLNHEGRSKYLARTRDFFKNLNIYVKQFYPDVDFLKYAIKGHDSLEVLFNECYRTLDNIDRIFEACKDFKYLEDNTEVINTIINFFSIIEEFVIRYYDYSIIGVSNQNYIITSCNNCDKVFFDYLKQGYSLIRLQKVYLVDNSYYEYVPALPTKDIGYPIEEYIETIDNDGKKYIKVL